MKRKKGYFSISAVSKMFSIHQQTIRLYEKEGLINPKRSAGNTRLFSEEDVNSLEEVIYLTHKLGINLAGVEMVLKLQKQVKKMQKDMNALFKNAQTELSLQTEIQNDVIKETINKIATLKKKTTTKNVDKPLCLPPCQETDENKKKKIRDSKKAGD